MLNQIFISIKNRISKISFRRIVKSGSFIPEIDGLRFIAVSSVVLYHIFGFLERKTLKTYNAFDFRIADIPFISNGFLGVELFFVISGFVLGLFFAKAYFKNSEVSLNSYFIRRLTRLEPPYILCMVLLFFGVLLVGKMSLEEGLISLGSSLLYIHNFVYPGQFPLLNGVAWSLEIEVQFYILAPLIAFVFKVKSKLWRRLILVLGAVIFSFLGVFFPLKFLSLYDYIEYFLIGFLLTDIFLTEKDFSFKGINIISIALLGFYFLLNAKEESYLIQAFFTLAQLFTLFTLFAFILKGKSLRFITNRTLTNIGGACYSIYLIHAPIISMFGNILVKFKFSEIKVIDDLIFSIIILTAILIVSGAFFLLIERPCMKRDWYKSFLKNKQEVINETSYTKL